MDSSTLVDNAKKNLLHCQIWLDTKGQCMKEANTLLDNIGYANIKQLERGILVNTKSQYMKESNILAGNAANNFLIREI